MKKMQPIHRFAAYIVCGFILAVALGFFLKGEHTDTTPTSQIMQESMQEEPVPDMANLPEGGLEAVPKEVDSNVIDITESLDDDALVVDGDEHSDARDSFDWNEDVWDNPLSIFSLQALSEIDEADEIEAVMLPEVKGRIAIIIDDMGIDMKHSYALMDMEGPFTLSFLPYAKKIDSQTEFARKKHHALMIHMPMEAVSGVMMDTPGLLKVGTSSNAFVEQLGMNLSRMHGYTGLNNHMGSLLTQDEGKMRLLMQELKEQGLYFIDSRTINTSVAADIAEAEGIPYLVRDVFLDHDPRPEAIMASLELAEKIAADKGLAIAIGHPKRETVEAIRKWAPTLKAKGYELVTIDQLIQEAYPEFQVKEVDDFSLIASPHQSHITALSIFD